MSNRYLKVTFDVLSVPDSDETCKEILAATAAQGTSIADIIRVDGKLRNVLLTMPAGTAATALSSIQDNPGVAITSPLLPPTAQAVLGGDLNATGPKGIVFTGNLETGSNNTVGLIQVRGFTGALDAFGNASMMGALRDDVPTGTDVYTDSPAIDPVIHPKVVLRFQDLHLNGGTGTTLADSAITLNASNGNALPIKLVAPFVFDDPVINGDNHTLVVYVDEDGNIYKRFEFKIVNGVSTVVQSIITYADAVDNGAI